MEQALKRVTTITNQQTQTTTALMPTIESHYTPTENISITNKINYTDPNFIPIGNIAIKKGTTKLLNEIKWDF